MKHTIFQFFTALLLAVCACSTLQAKKVVEPKMYMFGFSASFNDTIVYFTDIQEIDSVWIDKKSKFLQGRNLYAYQLRSFLAEKKAMPHRTCVVFYAKKRTKAEKEFLKMRKLYASKGKDGLVHFDVRYLDNGEFRFKAVDMSEDGETGEQQFAVSSKNKKEKKSKARPADEEKNRKELVEKMTQSKDRATERRQKAGEEMMEQKNGRR